jgi:site-specific DNA recombinase
VIYTRQSKDGEGNGLAVARQLAECRKLAAERGWTVAREFEDNDTSASNGKARPGFDAAMTMISEGRAGLLIVWAADRLVRKLADFERVIELFERTGAKLVTVSGDLDLSTDAGRLVGRILASVAPGEVERKSARQKLAAQQSARAGKRWTGCPRPFGYLGDHATPDPAEAAAIQEAARMLLGKSTIAAVVRDWSARGLRPPQAPYGPLPRNPWTATA